MNHSTFTPPSAVAVKLGDEDYNRQRLSPLLKDPNYVHLSDIRIFLEDYEDESFGTVLDYGCGGSPYRPLFKADNYLRGDYVDCGNLDCLIGADGKVPLPDNVCDAVISTQVMEHVLSPRTYLSEALRVLRPGGKLILTTHGIWEDHGCPYDFRRWTYDGLCRDIKEVGFEVTRAAKLTTGPRAVCFLLFQVMPRIDGSRLSPLRLASGLLRHSLGSPRRLHKWMDKRFADYRMVNSNDIGHGLYLALGVEGRKPR